MFAMHPAGTVDDTYFPLENEPTRNEREDFNSVIKINLFAYEHHERVTLFLLLFIF